MEVDQQKHHDHENHHNCNRNHIDHQSRHVDLSSKSVYLMMITIVITKIYYCNLVADGYVVVDQHAEAS